MLVSPGNTLQTDSEPYWTKYLDTGSPSQIDAYNEPPQEEIFNLSIPNPGQNCSLSFLHYFTVGSKPHKQRSDPDEGGKCTGDF